MTNQKSSGRTSKEIQERIYNNRCEKIKMRGGFTPEELIKRANNPTFYRRPQKI